MGSRRLTCTLFKCGFVIVQRSSYEKTVPGLIGF